MGPTRRVTAAVLTAATVLVVGSVLPGGAASAEIGRPRPALLAAGQPTALNLAANPPEVATGRATNLSGRLTDPVTGSGLTGAQVRLETRAADGSWGPVAVLTTDGSGAVASAQVPLGTSVYRFRHGEPGAPEASVSPEVSVPVRPLTAGLSRDAVRVGGPVVVSGMLAAPGGRLLRLERREAGRWVRADSTRTAPDGTYSFTAVPTTPGFWRWRVVRSAAARPGAVAVLPAVDAFRLHLYTVAKRGSIRADMGDFRAGVAATYADPRGWLRAHHRFRFVDRGGDFTVVLSQARYLPAYSSVCSSTYSCRVGRYVIINQDRWRRGSPYFPGTLEQYRRMVVNHETGHWLGRGHAFCTGSGRLAPVMQQQSKGMHGCRVNPWPLPREIRAVS